MRVVWKIIALLLLLFLFYMLSCNKSYTIDQQCKLPEFLTGGKNLRLNMSIDDIPAKDSLHRELLPGSFSWLPFENDALFTIILHNGILPAGMYTEVLTDYHRTVRGIVVTGTFLVDTEEDCLKVYEFFAKNISNYYNKPVKLSIDSIKNYNGEKSKISKCEGEISICGGHRCNVILYVRQDYNTKYRAEVSIDFYR